MNLSQFKTSLKDPNPPSGLTPILASLWYDGKGHWGKAHDIAQEIHTKEGSWIHAYLHRKEGDEFNASYWYQRAGKEKPAVSLAEEWERIVESFLRNEV